MELERRYRETFAQVHCPARAAAAPATQSRRGTRLAVCLAAPLLLAAGLAVGRVGFTNLRESPCPSFSPRANTGYAISFPYRTFALDDLDEELRTAPAGSGGQVISMTLFEDALPHNKASVPFETWRQAADCTGLPLLENAYLDGCAPAPCITLTRYQEDSRGTVLLDERGRRVVQSRVEYPIIVSLLRDADGRPETVALQWYVRDAAGLRIELESWALLAPEGSPTAEGVLNRVMLQKESGLTWEAEEYTLPTGDVAILPVCTSNPESFFRSCRAYFVHDGVLYGLGVTGQGRSGAERRAALETVLDNFTAPPA